ncbi:hypothetical protein CsSME_00002311 [Camellia sinensis var. sinensis]
MLTKLLLQPPPPQPPLIAPPVRALHGGSQDLNIWCLLVRLVPWRLFVETRVSILHPNDHAETVCGSPLYMAPEILQFQQYDAKILQNVQSCSCLPFSELILPGLHPDCVDMCSRLLSIKPGYKDLEVKAAHESSSLSRFTEIKFAWLSNQERGMGDAERLKIFTQYSM